MCAGAPPDFLQGYGRVTLRNTLPLPTVYTGFDLYVDDLRDIVAGQTLYYMLKVASSNVTLRYTRLYNVAGILSFYFSLELFQYHAIEVDFFFTDFLYLFLG